MKSNTATISGQWKRFVIASDVHGDMQDAASIRALFKFCEKWKPELRIFAGDLWDFRPLRKGASDDERRETLRTDYGMGMEFLTAYRPDVFLRGNHDERLWNLAVNGVGVASEFASSVVDRTEKDCAKLGARLLPYHKRDGVYRVGSLKVLHGFAAGIYATRATALIYGASVIGHVHTVDEHAIPGLERRVCRAIGCLCRLDMDYNATRPTSLRHAHGFAFGVIHKPTGKYHIWQAEQIGEHWIVPSDLVTL